MILALLAVGGAPSSAQPQEPPCIAIVPRSRGTVWTYALSYSSAGSYDLARLFGSVAPRGASTAAKVASGMAGALRITLVANDGDTVVARVVGDGVHAHVEAGGASTDMRQVGALFTAGFHMIFAPGGRLIGFRLPAWYAEDAGTFVRAVFGAAQFTVPCALQPGGSANWTSREEDANGEYEAYYTTDAAGPSRSQLLIIRKRKGPYVADSTRPGASGGIIEVRSRAEIVGVLNVAARRLDEVAGADTQVVRAAETQLGESLTTMRMAFVAETPVDTSASPPSSDTGYVFMPLHTPPNAGVATRRILGRTLGTRTVGQVMAALRQLDSTDGRAAATTRVFRLVQAFVVLRPDDVDSLSSLLHTGDAASPAFRTLSAAYAAAGTPAAERALAAALAARAGDEAASRRLVASLGSVEQLSRTGIQALQSAFERTEHPRTAAEAALTLGGAAAALARPNPPLSDSIVRWLGEQLSRHLELGRRVAVVRGLGNAAVPRAVGDLRMALGDSSAEVRAAAVSGLRAYRDTVTTRRLLLALSGDPSTLVRWQAAAALRMRGDDAVVVRAESEALVAERDAGVRAEIVRNLWMVRERWPKIGELLRRRAAIDPSAAVRELIAGLVAHP